MVVKGYKKIFSVSMFYLFVATCVLGSAMYADANMPDKADMLKKELTPLGGERAANSDGTIPAWEGGFTSIPANVKYDPKSGDLRPDPFAADKVLFSISAKNMDQYADKLSEGQKALMKKYPTYKINVYPTHRTAAAPQWVYDNTYKNAKNAKLTADKLGATGAYGGIPFPIPTEGAEIIINHNARWEGGGDTGEQVGNYIVQPNGTITDGGSARYRFDRHYYNKNGTLETYDNWMVSALFEYFSPARRKGEIILSKNPMNYEIGSKAAWQYMPGQRRVRRAPSIDYDTPNPSAGGISTYDDAYMFNGPIDRFDWKLVGKKEMFIPYHNYKYDLVTLKDILTPNHINPEYVRWELHRVWVVEATLKQGSRHCYSKRMCYFDEDTWFNALQDKYDTRGNLWRTSLGTSIIKYDGGDLIGFGRRSVSFYDLQGDSYAVGYVVNDLGKGVLFDEENPDEMFDPQYVRKIGNR